MYNKTIMLGNLTRDIELRYTPNGLAIAKSSVATTHKYKLQNGEQKEEVCFLEFNIMGRIAEVANQYLRKGSKVMLEGRLILEQWTDSTGQKKSKHSLKVETMKMLDSKSNNSEPYQAQENPNYTQNQYQQQPPLMDENDEIPY